MRGFLADIRYAFRTPRHSGISAVVAVLSLAVGVGANAAIFSVGYAMLARPLPYPDADRLVMLRSMNPSHGVLWTTTAPANLLDWQTQAKSFEAPLYPEMHRRISDIDKDAFVSDVKPMTQIIAESLTPRRFSTILLSTFATFALILSLAGISGVIAHSVAQRTVEIGIRIALGASPASVTSLMFRYGLLPAICGMAVGWSGAFATSRFLSAILFGVGPLDLPTWIVVSSSMLAVASIASYLPARRACSIDPTVALRAE